MKHRIVVVLSFALAIAWSSRGVAAQVVQLKSGEILVAKVADAHEDGLETDDPSRHSSVRGRHSALPPFGGSPRRRPTWPPSQARPRLSG